MTGYTADDRCRTISVLVDVAAERERQVNRYGHNDDLDLGTGPGVAWMAPDLPLSATELERYCRAQYEKHETATGRPTWRHLILEEVAESFQEDDPERLEAELMQVAALAVSCIETLRKRAT